MARYGVEWRRWPLALLTLALAGCEGGAGVLAFGSPAGGSVAIATVTVTPSSATFTAIGQQQQFTAAAQDSSNIAVAATFTWSSSNTAVVTVDSTGVARSVGNGFAAVIAQANRVTGSASVNVSAP